LNAKYVAAFRRGLQDEGYVDGQNLAVEYRWAEDHRDRLPGLAEGLVRRNVEVIAPWSSSALGHGLRQRAAISLGRRLSSALPPVPGLASQSRAGR
jgi:putative tryptophan/tyrosine transport system substrate-binding protein